MVVKNSLEKASHVYMKAFLWALYAPAYPGLNVELSLGMRYKPDVVALDERGGPLFWGEAGHVELDKLARLFRQFPRTHFAVAKWGRATHWDLHLEKLLRPLRRMAPVDFLVFPEQAAQAWISEQGEIEVPFEKVLRARFTPASREDGPTGSAKRPPGKNYLGR